MTRDREQIIKEITDTWPPHLQDEYVSLGEQTVILDGLFSRNDLWRICVGMTTLQVRLDLLKFMEGDQGEVSQGPLDANGGD